VHSLLPTAQKIEANVQIGAVAKYDHDRAEGPLAKLAADSPGIIKVRLLSCVTYMGFARLGQHVTRHF
jgi:hypothetical protein